MVIVVGNSRFLKQSKKRKDGTYPLTGLALNPVSGLRNRFTSSSRGTRLGSRQRLSMPWRKRWLA
jgi:hypothetical protein